MNDIVSAATAGLHTLNYTNQEKHIRTGDIRKLSAHLFRNIKDKSKDHVFAVCGELLEQNSWPMKVIAFDFAYRMKKQYDGNTFTLFESWLEKYVRGWGDCDDFCTHAFGELICQDTSLVKHIIPWTGREEFWMRRAAAVVLIPSILRDKYRETEPLRIADRLLTDKHDLVRKGYGWTLKTLSVKEPQLVRDYLIKNKDIMPRVAFRYALEKMDRETKMELMKL
ncbi:MAG: DNA alkylation repair protein [Clostridiaceae bacterium]|nr:DNA alkylation repair protein [Clostridiaceae bacterium]